jgi:hypothetical protein
MNDSFQLMSVSGNLMRVFGSVCLPVEVGSNHTFVAADIRTSPISTADFLIENNMTVDLCKRRLVLNTEYVDLLINCPYYDQCRAVLKEDTTLVGGNTVELQWE